MKIGLGITYIFSSTRLSIEYSNGLDLQVQVTMIPFLVRVECRIRGGFRFTINGRDCFKLVLISNVGRAGEISKVWIKGSKTEWLAMARNWGANWQSHSYLNGQSLSFRIQTSNGRIRTAYDAAPSNWKFAQTFSSSVQF